MGAGVPLQDPSAQLPDRVPRDVIDVAVDRPRREGPDDTPSGGGLHESALGRRGELALGGRMC